MIIITVEFDSQRLIYRYYFFPFCFHLSTNFSLKNLSFFLKNYCIILVEFYLGFFSLLKISLHPSIFLRFLIIFFFTKVKICKLDEIAILASIVPIVQSVNTFLSGLLREVFHSLIRHREIRHRVCDLDLRYLSHAFVIILHRSNLPSLHA